MTRNMKIALTAVAALFAATSCMTVKLSSMKDEELAAAGVRAWNEQRPEDARPYWEAIRDPSVQEKYLANYDKAAEVEKRHAAALAVGNDKIEEQQKAFRAFIAEYEAFPKELELRGDFKKPLRPLTVNVVERKTYLGRMDEAKAFAEEAEAFLGASDDYGRARAEMAAYPKLLRMEKEADSVYAAAKEVEAFDERVDALEGAIAAYQKTESAADAEVRKVGAAKGSVVAAVPLRIKKKRGEARVEVERTVRERGTSFKERIGEEFARVPEGNKLGNMGAEDILKFNEEIRANIEKQYVEVVEFGKRYPDVIDEDMIADIDRQKKELDDRITVIAEEVRRAKDIASRGKAAIPLQIGLFNPAPGSKAEGEKSRPAQIKGRIAEDADYWWGMVSISPGKMNDLVVSLKDGKEVQVYADNTLSGTQIKKKKLTNLVDRGSRIGNSWPVLNAGAVLPKGQYYIRIMENGNPAYSGEVVVYSSFISRMR